jgi:hypothetical protein
MAGGRWRKKVTISRASSRPAGDDLMVYLVDLFNLKQDCEPQVTAPGRLLRPTAINAPPLAREPMTLLLSGQSRSSTGSHSLLAIVLFSKFHSLIDLRTMSSVPNLQIILLILNFSMYLQWYANCNRICFPRG